jgi:hypothetical protein
MFYRLLRFASIIYCEVCRESPKRFPWSAASLAREANCAGGRIKEAEYAALFGPTFLPSLESDTHQSQRAKMMGFAKGSTHPTG